MKEAALNVDAEIIGMVKTNTKGFCKETIDNIIEKWLGGSYLVLRSNNMVPGGIRLITIGYKYDVRKVLYFIIKEDTGMKKSGIPYLSKYPITFSNVSICPFAHLLVMYKFFAYGNVV